VHIIDESSPLFGHSAETLATATTRVFVTIAARDQALAALVEDMKDYPAAHIRFGMHFADAVMVDGGGKATADLTRISLLEPDTVTQGQQP